MVTTPSTPSNSFLVRHEFLIRRLFSLSGLIPVGAYMVVHLITNASLLNSTATYQRAVYAIHGLGMVLPTIEWIFIFLPILFHGIVGLVVIRGGMPNSTTYRYGSNVRFTLQRATGMIAFAFILWHVFHMHGWLHFTWWTDNVTAGLRGGMFKPYNAASSLAEAMTFNVVVPILYAIGLLSCVFHLANGLWTFGITWGLWTTEGGMRRAKWVSGVFGVLLAGVAVGAWLAPLQVDKEDALTTEVEMYQDRLDGHEVEPNEHKLSERGRELREERESGSVKSRPRPAREVARTAE